MNEPEDTVRIKDKKEHDDGSVTVTYEVVSPDGVVVAEFTGRAGASVAAHGNVGLLEAGRRLHDPRLGNKL